MKRLLRSPGRLAAALCALAVMAAIFCLSAQPGERSFALSSAVGRAVGATPLPAEGGEPQNYVWLAGLNIRKIAHMALYAALGASVFFALAPGRLRAPAALAICYAYAALDEFHQSFTGRTASFTDTLYDAAGAAAAIALCLGAAALARRLRKKRREEA